MKKILTLAAAAWFGAACNDSGELGHFTEPELAKGKPQADEVCMDRFDRSDPRFREFSDARIGALCYETQDATALLSKRADKDRTGLMGQLNRADTQCSERDLRDAIEKLNEFRDKVLSLIAENKIDPGDAAELLNGGGAWGTVGVNALLAEGALVCG